MANIFAVFYPYLLDKLMFLDLFIKASIIVTISIYNIEFIYVI